MTENTVKPTLPAPPGSTDVFAETFLSHRFPLVARFSKPMSVSRLFKMKTGSKSGIIALWNVWREDTGYIRAWRCWRRMLRIVRRTERDLDKEWKHLKNSPYSTAHYDKRHELNTIEFRHWHRQQRFLACFAKRYGIPPIDPELDGPRSVDVEEGIEQVIREWRPGKWHQPVWSVEDEDDADRIRSVELPDQLDWRSQLLFVVDPHYSLPRIRAAVEEQVRMWRAMRPARPFTWARPKERHFADYAMAWYLHYKKGWGWTDIARKLFKNERVFSKSPGKMFENAPDLRKGREKMLADKARKYALCGKCLHRGAVELIKDEETPGVHPLREQQKQEKRFAAIKRKSKKQGMGKAGVRPTP